MFNKFPRSRKAAYYVYALVGLGVTYATAKGYIGGDEIAVYTGVGVIFGLTAGSNVNTSDEQGRHEAEVEGH